MLSVIVCTCNRAGTLRKALSSLVDSISASEADCEVVVIDNNSSDATAAVVGEVTTHAPCPVIYAFEPQQGVSFARNRGLEIARGSEIAFTDDDVLVDPQWIRELAAAFKAHPWHLGFGGRVIPQWPSKPPSWFQETGPYATVKAVVCHNLGPEPGDTDTSPIGANMAFRKIAFERYGTFRTDLGRKGNILTGGEDIEFFRRLFAAGERVRWVPSAIVLHPVDASRTHKRYFELWCYHGARSQLRIEGVPANTVFYWGIPRYLLRDLVTTCCLWITGLEAKRRFFYRLQFMIALGSIVEARRLRVSGGASGLERSARVEPPACSTRPAK